MNSPQPREPEMGKEPAAPKKSGAAGYLRTLPDRVDGFLWRRGFGPGLVRLTARWLILLTAGLGVAGLALLPLAFWPFWLAVGAALSTWNFYAMAFFVQRAFPGAPSSAASTKRMMVGQVVRSNLRLFITGILVYASLVRFHANPFALAAGLSLAVATIPVLALLRRT